MCIKLSLLTRSVAVVSALVSVTIVAAVLRVAKKGSEEGCYFHFPNQAVCGYAITVSLVTIISGLTFLVLDCCLSVRRNRGKRFKKADVVVSLLLCLMWVACGGTMAGFDAALSKEEKEIFSDGVRNFASASVVMAWVGCVSWLIVVLMVCCSNEEPEAVPSLLAGSTHEDDMTKSEENRPLLAKS